MRRKAHAGNKSIAAGGADGRTIGYSSLSATVTADEQSRAKVLNFIF